MGNFSDELSGIMRIRKIAVDDIIQSMNISRAAFFKYKNGTRLPAKAEIVEEIADALRLNYNERNSLLESYQIDSIGEYKYRGMQAVERFLTTPVGEFSTKEFDFAAPAADKMANLSVVHGKMHVLMRIYTTICEGLNDGDVIIFETICDKDVFSVLQQVREANKTNTIEHIMAMNGSDDIHAKDQLYAIESLGSMLITMCRCENYYPFYYYASLSTLRTFEEFMTNTVVTKNCVFCYSGNMDSGVLYRDERLCSHYRDVIARWRKRAKPFAEKMDLTTSLRSFLAFRSSLDEKYEFIPGICMASIYEENDNLINTNLIVEEGAANRQIYDLVNYSEEFKKGLNAAKERNHFIVPGNTLRFNLNTGYIQELPKKVTIPLGRDTMYKMLRRFQQVCDTYDFRIIEDDRFPEDNSFNVEVTQSQAMITVILPGEAIMRMFLVKESSAVSLIYEYLKHLYDNEAISGRERSAWFEGLFAGEC